MCSQEMLSGLSVEQGDVIIISAGSAGLAQTYTPGASRHDARLWPSFNSSSSIRTASKRMPSPSVTVCRGSSLRCRTVAAATAACSH